LPLLRNTIEKMLARKHELAIQAGRLPLEDYYERYLRVNKSCNKAYKSISQRDEDIKRKVAIIVALKNDKFYKYNPYLSELEHNPNDALFEQQELCNSYLPRCGDKGLSREVKGLFKTYSKYQLVLALAEMGLSNDLRLKAPKHYKALYHKPDLLKPFIAFYQNRINKKIDSLLRGEDL